jgi:serine/threonine protein phosphatase PrpC
MIELAILSEQGGRNYNEDACGHWHSDRYLCCVVCDGAGGHGGGDVASKLVVSHLLTRYAQQPAHDPQALHDLLLDCNRALLAEREASTEHRHMQTTVAVLSIDLEASTAFWGHSGDTRLYALRAGVVAERTLDHSLVQSLIDAGLLTPEEALHHPKRNEIYSALGNDWDTLHVNVSTEPWRLQEGDALLLCTDGMWEWVTDAELVQELADSSDPQDWLSRLARRVVTGTAHKPNHDNYSAIAVRL